MNEWGKVVAVKGRNAVISIQKKEECNNCNRCRPGRGENEMTVEARNKIKAQIGDTVEISDEILNPFETFFINAGIPITDAIIGGLIGYVIAELLLKGNNILLWISGCAIVFGLLSFVLSKKLLQNINNLKSNRFQVSSIIHKEG